MKKFTREDKKNLMKKVAQNKKSGKHEFDGLNKEEQLAIALWQIEVLDRDSKLSHVRESWEKWNRVAKMLVHELLQETLEVTTNKGIRKVLNVDGNMATICKICNGTGRNLQARNNMCSCTRGWFYDNKMRVISEDDYKKRALKRYRNVLNKKRILSKHSDSELLKMSLDDFLDVTKVHTL